MWEQSFRAHWQTLLQDKDWWEVVETVVEASGEAESEGAAEATAAIEAIGEAEVAAAAFRW